MVNGEETYNILISESKSIIQSSYSVKPILISESKSIIQSSYSVKPNCLLSNTKSLSGILPNSVSDNPVELILSTFNP